MPLLFLSFAFSISFAVVAILALATITLLVPLENFFCNARVNFLEINEIPLGTIIDPGTFFSS
jgi:ABC-type nickel/cobalt efflux system permease component RcnA